MQPCIYNLLTGKFIPVKPIKEPVTASPYKIYHREVARLTNLQPIHTLPNYNKRGLKKRQGYAIDHIIPVRYGFDNNIEPRIIAHILNLQCIRWQDNIKKGATVPSNVEAMISIIERQLDLDKYISM